MSIVMEGLQGQSCRVRRQGKTPAAGAGVDGNGMDSNHVQVLARLEALGAQLDSCRSSLDGDTDTLQVGLPGSKGSTMRVTHLHPHLLRFSTKMTRLHDDLPGYPRVRYEIRPRSNGTEA